MTVSRLLEAARLRLKYLPDARLESEALLCFVLGVDRAWLYANFEQEPRRGLQQNFERLVEQREQGQPFAYLTGTREFWSLPLIVTPDVLIPRPETELLVETALKHLPVDKAARVADLGTGSGAVALAIASERPNCEVHATDISEAALSVAQRNAGNLKLSTIHFHQGSWLAPLSGRFDVIVSNPPYVAAADPHLEAGDCRFEPEVALTPGPDGMESIEIIASKARSYLVADGLLAFEHGHDQGVQCRELLRYRGYQQVKTLADLAGIERITLGYRENQKP